MPWLRGLLELGSEDLEEVSSSRESDDRLVARCLAGEAGAFDELVTAYSSMVYGLAFRQLGDRDEALDLSQEVFLRIYRKLESFRGDSSLKTWIFRIALNLARNRQKWWKARRRDRTVSLDDRAPGRGEEGPLVGDRLSDDRHDPERDARNRDTQRLVSEGLQELTLDHRQILVLRDLEELSYEEIAQILELSEGTVKSRIARARMRLKAVLDGKLS